MNEVHHLEDVVVGQKCGSGEKVVDEGEVRALPGLSTLNHSISIPARPLRASSAGLPPAAGTTGAMIMRLLVDSELRIAGGIIGMGFDECRWLRPVRPGDSLHVESEVVAVEPSKTKPAQGLAKVRITTFNQNNEPVLVLLAKLVVPRRRPEETVK
jgi:hypothetical protein